MTPRQPRPPRGLALTLALLLGPIAVAQKPAEQEPTGFVTAYLEEARGKLAEGDTAAAERALERDQNSLATLELLAKIAEQQSDLDTAVHSLHRWLDVHDARTRKSTPARKAVHEVLAPIDSEATSITNTRSA